MPSIDYLNYTIKNAVIDVLGILDLAWKCLPDEFVDKIWSASTSTRSYRQSLLTAQYEISNGKYGYKKCLYFPAVDARIYFSPCEIKKGEKIVRNMGKDAYDLQNPNRMGTFFSLSGNSFENIDSFTLEQAAAFWDKLVLCGHDFSIRRCDVAYDCDVDFSKWLRKVELKQYVTRLHKVDRILDENNRGTIYFGERSGNTFVRIYDKNLEQKIENSENPWTRFEVEFKHDNAEVAYKAFCDGDIGDYVIGAVKFVDKRCKNMARDAKVWNEQSKIIAFDAVKRVSRIRKESTLNWLETQVGDVLKTVEVVYPGYVARLLKDSDVNLKKKAKLEKQKRQMLKELYEGSPQQVVGKQPELVQQLSLLEA